MKVLFLVNPRSGTNRRLDVAARIREACSEWREVARVEACGSREELDHVIADAEAGGLDAVFAVGGDGTVHEIAKRLVGRSLALGIVPTGSGNGLARHLRIPLSIERATELGRSGQIVAIDTAAVNGAAFIGTLGIGFDAEVAHRFAQKAERGLRTYVRAGFDAWFSYEAQEYEITIDGRVELERAFAITVANSNQYGNDARVAPHASLQDGLLDIVSIAKPALASVPIMAFRMFRGSFDRAEEVKTRQARALVIRRSSGGPAHVDGEPIHLPEELRIELKPLSLRVLVPAGASAL